MLRRGNEWYCSTETHRSGKLGSYHLFQMGLRWRCASAVLQTETQTQIGTIGFASWMMCWHSAGLRKLWYRKARGFHDSNSTLPQQRHLSAPCTPSMQDSLWQ